MKPPVSRRRLLGYGAAGATAFLTGLPSLSSAKAVWGDRKKAKNIIFCVSDGMSAAVPSMLDQYLEATTGQGSHWTRIMGEDYAVNGLQDTRSLTGFVTDSSAASSAWGSGVHIWNGAVNWLPSGDKGIELRTLLEILKTEGKMKTGIVTTASITHATPAGFIVSHNNRDEEWVIADKYLRAAPDVLMGGGDKFFSAEKRVDKTDLYAKFRSAGYDVARSAGELATKSGKKPLLGIFSSGHMPYTIDQLHDSKLGQQTPTLAQMAIKAIDCLNSSSGFILQVEGARIDHGGHTNDFAAQLFDQMAFDEAVGKIIDWALNDGETLVVVTSDHANGNPGLSGAGEEYADSSSGLLKYQNFTSSFSPILGLLKEKSDVNNVMGVIKEKCAVELSGAEAQFVVDGLKKTSETRLVDVFAEDISNLAMALSNHTHVAYMTHNHTSDHVLVTAVGPGSDMFHGLTRNVTYFDTLLSHREITFKNPTVSYEDARKHYVKEGVCAKSAEHWI